MSFSVTNFEVELVELSIFIPACLLATSSSSPAGDEAARTACNQKFKRYEAAGCQDQHAKFVSLVYLVKLDLLDLARIDLGVLIGAIVDHLELVSNGEVGLACRYDFIETSDHDGCEDDQEAARTDVEARWSTLTIFPGKSRPESAANHNAVDDQECDATSVNMLLVA